MFTRKRKSNEMENIDNENNIDFLLNEIKNLLMEKNIYINEQIIEDGNERDININLTDKNNNLIGNINGGIGDFSIIENGYKIEKKAFSISWVNIEKNYQGNNLGTFLIVYCIYLCKKKFTDIQFIVLDDDTDETNTEKNIYKKLGFIYQETKEIIDENGNKIEVNTSSEMQLNISDFFNNNLLDKLNRIKISIKNLKKKEDETVGGKKKKKRRKTKKKIKKNK